MEEIQAARTLITSKQIDIETAIALTEYAKKLMTVYRNVWFPPPQAIFQIEPAVWLEELLLVACQISQCFAFDPKKFIEEGLSTPFFSILIFASTLLKQTDIVAPLINSLIQNCSKPTLLIPYLVSIQHTRAVALLLEAFREFLPPSTIMVACLLICHDLRFSNLVLSFLDALEPIYPFQVASIRVTILFLSQPDQIIPAKLQTALNYLQNVISEKNYPEAIFNAALAAAKVHEKEKAFRFARQALTICPSDQRTCLLVVRILFSNCQFDEALSLIGHKTDKLFLLETMKIFVNKGDLQGAEAIARKLRSKWPTDPIVLFHCLKNALLLGRITAATEILQVWADFDNESSNYFYALSQVCLLCKDLAKAEQYIEIATELDPTNAELQAALCEILMKNGKKEKALDRAKYAIEMDPNCLYAWVIYEKVTPNEEEAKMALKKAILLRKNMINLTGLDFILLPHQLGNN